MEKAFAEGFVYVGVNYYDTAVYPSNGTDVANCFAINVSIAARNIIRITIISI